MNIHDTRIWLDSTKGEIGCFCRIAFCERVKEGRFSDIWESDDSEVHRKKTKAKEQAKEGIFGSGN